VSFLLLAKNIAMIIDNYSSIVQCFLT